MKPSPSLLQELEALRTRLAEAEETLQSIRRNEVDALVISGTQGDQIYTLKGAETPYRIMAESMNEGAATLDHRATIVFANSRFAELVVRPLERVLGVSFYEFVPAEEHDALTKAFFKGRLSSSRGEFTLLDGHSNRTPVQLSMSCMAMDHFEGICLLAADLTERKEYETALRRLNRGLRCLSECNQIVVRTQDELELFRRICKLLVTMGAYRVACIALAEPGNSKTLRLAAWADAASEHVPSPERRKPVALDLHPALPALRTAKPVLYRIVSRHPQLKPWRQLAAREGVGSALVLPLIADQEAFGVLTIGAKEPEAFDKAETDLLVKMADNVAFAIRLIHMREERRLLEKEILRICEREQERVGQDLHDSICQTLVAARFLTGALRDKLARQKSVAKTEIETETSRIDGLISEITQQAYTLSRGLLPLQADCASLDAALRELAGRFASIYSVACRFQASGRIAIRDQDVAIHFYRIAQEAISNAIKHSRATAILVALDAKPHGLELTVSDNGIGLPRKRRASKGLGLRTMRYRANTIGARFAVSSVPGQGTQVTVFYPNGVGAKKRSNALKPTPNRTGSNRPLSSPL